METLRDWECFDADSGKNLAVELRDTSSPISRTGRRQASPLGMTGL